MKKHIILVLLAALLILLSACSNTSTQTTTAVYDKPHGYTAAFLYKNFCASPPQYIPQPKPQPPDEVIILPDQPTPPSRQGVPGSTTILVSGTHHTISTLDIQGELYADTVVLQKMLGHIPPSTSTHMQDGNKYVNLHHAVDALGFRLNHIQSRDTFLLDLAPQAAVTEAVFTAEPIPEHIVRQIMGSSFHENPHFGLSHLAYLTLTHVDFNRQRRTGHMIVAASIAEEVLDIFREIYEGGFPIERIRLIDYYAATDYYSMADNNSVAFNFRYIAGTTRLSRHAWGMAIDINPVQNPYIRGETIWPAAGADYLNRDDVRPGMIVPGDVVYNAFTSRGWRWGGHWNVPIDYHHFER